MNVLGIQFKISDQDFQKDGYARHIEKFYKKSQPDDIIVFPEDVGLITAFEGISANTLIEAMGLLYDRFLPEISQISEKYPETDPASTLFLALTGKFVQDFYNLFSELSSKYSVYTVTCNNMPEFKSVGTQIDLIGAQVYNTAYVFDTKGNEVFNQKKVYLVDMEKSLGISPGSIEDVMPFKIKDKKIGIAISLDAFMPDYITKLSEADLILQPDANAEKWNSYLNNGRWQPEEWMDSAYYITQRIASVKYTINPMMVGNILGLIFEGQSSVIKKAENTDRKMAYIGNVPTAGFEALAKIKGYDTEESVPREKLEKLELEYEEDIVYCELENLK